MKPPAWWPLTKTEWYATIIGSILLAMVNLEWYLHQSWPYPMEGAPPSAILLYGLLFTTGVIYLLCALKADKALVQSVRWFTSIPLLLAGFTNFMWPYMMFNSWYGSMSAPNIFLSGGWSCWMVGGGYWLGWFLLVPIGYIIGIKGLKSMNAAWYLVAAGTVMASMMWYWYSWII